MSPFKSEVISGIHSSFTFDLSTEENFLAQCKRSIIHFFSLDFFRKNISIKMKKIYEC